MSLLHRYAKIVCEFRLQAEKPHADESAEKRRKMLSYETELRRVPSVMIPLVQCAADKMWNGDPRYSKSLLEPEVYGKAEDQAELGSVYDTIEQTQKLLVGTAEADKFKDAV